MAPCATNAPAPTLQSRLLGVPVLPETAPSPDVMKLPLRCRVIAVFALALLIKAGMPVLASLSAHLQGVSVAAVCAVYGVATIKPAADAGAEVDEHAGHHGGHHGQHGSPHKSEHCALSGMVALSAPAAQHATDWPRLERAAAPQQRQHSATARDACTAWAARLQHGPPTLA